jgi:two-component system, sensor histidine kinase PdtaS
LIGKLRRYLSTSSLGVRLGSTIMFALLPLGVLSVVQTRDALQQVDAATLEGVGGASLQAVRSQIALINEAQISARVLAAVLGQSLNGDTACVDRVKAVAEDIPQSTMVAYIPLGGLMTCSSNGRVYNFSSEPIFLDLIKEPEPKVVYNPHGPVSGTAVIGISHPVFDRAGVQVGIVSVSLSYTSVAPRDFVDPLGLWRPGYLGTIQADGTLLLSSNPDTSLESVLPDSVDLARIADLADQPRFFDTASGRKVLSVVAVTPEFYLLSVWQRDAGVFWQRAGSVTPYLLPALTWFAAFVAAAFASSRLVVRHVRALSRSMTDYVATQRRMQVPEMSDAPIEIQRLHSAYEGMIRTIEQEEADLQNLLIDKDTLIREVNHRSGNSLQIIASIMRTYRRETTDQKLRSVLDGLINRVIALSSTHTSLYALSGQRDVAMDVVLSNVVKRLKEIHGVSLGVASKRLQPIRMDPQAAVPLALALAEAVGCFFSRPGLMKEAVLVDLSEAEGTIRLRVEGPEVPELRPESQDGLVSLPQRMMRQFAAQLFGTISIHQEGDRATVELVFPRPKAKS